MAGEKELVQYIFEGKASLLVAPFETWLKSSRRFKTFAETYRGKIRKKLRNTHDRERLKDLWFELEVAYQLHREPSFTVSYEQQATGNGRSPDFTVLFKTHTPFNIEVTRMQVTGSPEASVSPLAYKLIEMVCDKVGQMPPSTVNIIITTADCEAMEADFTQAMTALRMMAERKVEAFFIARGFKDAADFLKQFRQLSAILFRNPTGTLVWHNSLAKHALPKDIALALQRAFQ